MPKILYNLSQSFLMAPITPLGLKTWIGGSKDNVFGSMFLAKNINLLLEKRNPLRLSLLAFEHGKVSIIGLSLGSPILVLSPSI
jgi:hypothetical protein